MLKFLENLSTMEKFGAALLALLISAMCLLGLLASTNLTALPVAETDGDVLPALPSSQEFKTRFPKTIARQRAEAAKTAHSPESLLLRNDGPADFSHPIWTDLKRCLLADGYIDIVASNDEHLYSVDPRSFEEVFREMRLAFEEHGFTHPTAKQIYNGAMLFGLGRGLAWAKRARILELSGLARMAHKPLCTAKQFADLESTSQIESSANDGMLHTVFDQVIGIR